LSLGEPIVPYLDRDLKIYRVSSKTSADYRKFDLSDEFYNRGAEEKRKKHRLKMEAGEQQGILRCVNIMRERDEQLELRRYNYCLVRVRFPDDVILQALFKSGETFGTLYEFVQEQLEYDSVPFELFGQTLKRNVELTDSLAEAGLAPAALINFKWNEDSVQEANQRGINIKQYIKSIIIGKFKNKQILKQ